VELRQLDYFLAIAQHASLSKAASVLGIAQPALSRRLRQLEAELDVQLFYRHGRGVNLTAEGEQLRDAITPLLRDLAQAAIDLKANSVVLSGPISLGMPPSIGAAIGARLVRIFRQRHPLVKLHIIEGFSGHVNEWLVAGRLDMAIINSARSTPNIQMDPVLEVDLFYVGPAGDMTAQMSAKATMPFARLAGVPLALPGRHHGLRREVEAAAQTSGVDLNIVVEMDALAALKHLVHLGEASTVLPQGAIADDFDNPALLIRKLVKPSLSMRFMLAYSHARPITPAMRELGRTLRDQIAEAVREGRIAGRANAGEKPG